MNYLNISAQMLTTDLHASGLSDAQIGIEAGGINQSTINRIRHGQLANPSLAIWRNLVIVHKVVFKKAKV